MSVKEIIAKNIRVLRAKNKISQDELADIAGLQRPHMSKLENAKTDPKITTIEKLAKALGVEPHELLKDK